MLGVSQAAVWEWVSGTNAPSLERFIQICEVVGVSASDLLGI